jgi:hypothetical protein
MKEGGNMTGEENISPSNEAESNTAPSKFSTNTTPAVLQTVITVALSAPKDVAGNVLADELIAAPLVKLHFKCPFRLSKQYKLPSCDPINTSICEGTKQGDENIGALLSNSHNCQSLVII